MKIRCLILFSFVYFTAFSQSSNLPLIFLNAEGAEIPGDPKIDIQMGIVSNADGVNHVGDPFNQYDGKIGIELRGSSSLAWPKKSYSFETRNEDGSNRNISLLGLPEENDWVLYGPYADKSLIRNVLTFKLGAEMGWWAPRARFCELYLDDAYQGIYVLMEKIKKDAHRVDIATLNPDEIAGDDLTGGYILKIDSPDDYWISAYPSPVGSYEVPISYVYPDYDDMPAEQREYIKQYVDDFEDALHGDDFMDPVTGYRQYINTASFIDYFLINELSKDVDAYRLSTYFYKDKDSKGGKLTMGPLWDFNFSWGNADYYDAFTAEGWMIHGVPAYDSYQAPFWWDRLREDPAFNAALKIRWESLRENTFSTSNIDTIIDSLASLLDNAQGRNFGTYPVLGVYIWPNYFVGDTYASEISFLKEWIGNRIAWMDEQISQIDGLKENLAVNGYEMSCFPNPFRDEIQLEYYALKSCTVDIRIYDQLGRLVSYSQENASAGYHQMKLDINPVQGAGSIYYMQCFIDGKILKTEKLLQQP